MSEVFEGPSIVSTDTSHFVSLFFVGVTGPRGWFWLDPVFVPGGQLDPSGMMSLFPESNEIMFSLPVLKEGQRLWFLGVMTDECQRLQTHTESRCLSSTLGQPLPYQGLHNSGQRAGQDAVT